MGTQISITSKVMVAAGWKEEEVGRQYVELDGDGEERVGYHYVSVFTKDNCQLTSYCNGSFFADCKEGGQNKALFQKVGLFDLPHSIC